MSHTASSNVATLQDSPYAANAPDYAAEPYSGPSGGPSTETAPTYVHTPQQSTTDDDPYVKTIATDPPSVT